MFQFKDLMIEGSGLVVMSFGRFNPPTIGHEKVIEKVKSLSGTAPFRIYPSHSVGPKDPLPHAKKVAYMRAMFPKYKKNIIADNSAKTVIDIAEKLYKEGFAELVMVAGSDRVKEFDTLLQKYNGKADKKGKILYKFNTVSVISAGQRDPDAEGVTGMSASKMRSAASDSDFDSFKNGIPSTLSDKNKKKLYLDVRKHMGIREAKEMGKLTDFESMRDAYLTGQVWKIDDIIEANGHTGKIINRGTNYLSFVDEDGKIHKTWLHDIVGGKQMSGPTGQIFALKSEEVDLGERDYKKEYANYQGTPEQIARRSSRNKARRIMGDKAVKGMDVGHKDNNPLNNDPKNLKNEDPSKNRREPRLREGDDKRKGDPCWDNYKQVGMKKKGGKQVPNCVPEDAGLDESWWNDLSAKISQVRHPKGWDKMVKSYVDGMKDPEHRAHPSAWASTVVNATTTNVDARQLIKYINRLVSQGKIPKELRAQTEEKEQQTFSDLVRQINSQDKKGK